MAQPLTKNRILTQELLEKVNKVARQFDQPGSNTLKSAGNKLVANITKFCFILTMNCFLDDETISEFDLARDMTTLQQEAVLQEFFLAIAIFMLSEDDDKDIKYHLFGTGSPGVRRFWSEYVMPLVERFNVKGKEKIIGVDLMEVICSKIESASEKAPVDTIITAVAKDRLDFDQKRFVLLSGKSISNLAPKTKSEFRKFVKDFKKDYLVNNVPRSGRTWESALNQFFVDIWRQREQIGEENQGLPSPTYLPTGSHAWLLFVCYGPYGNFKWGTTAPEYLMRSDAETIDAKPSTSRSAARARPQSPSPVRRSLSTHDEANEEVAGYFRVKRLALEGESRLRVRQAAVSALESKLKSLNEELNEAEDEAEKSRIKSERKIARQSLSQAIADYEQNAQMLAAAENKE